MTAIWRIDISSPLRKWELKSPTLVAKYLAIFVWPWATALYIGVSPSLFLALRRWSSLPSSGLLTSWSFSTKNSAVSTPSVAATSWKVLLPCVFFLFKASNKLEESGSNLTKCWSSSFSSLYAATELIAIFLEEAFHDVPLPAQGCQIRLP